MDCALLTLDICASLPSWISPSESELSCPLKTSQMAALSLAALIRIGCFPVLSLISAGSRLNRWILSLIARLSVDCAYSYSLWLLSRIAAPLLWLLPPKSIRFSVAVSQKRTPLHTLCCVLLKLIFFYIIKLIFFYIAYKVKNHYITLFCFLF